MDILEQTLEMVKPLLPLPGTNLFSYTFLTPDALWTGKYDRPFVAVAEDRWPSGGGYFLMVLADGPVYAADLKTNTPVSYCAAGFPRFMQIYQLLVEVRENTPLPDVDDDEGLAACETTEQLLRQRTMEIDPTAIQDTESFWSTAFEELGCGM